MYLKFRFILNDIYCLRFYGEKIICDRHHDRHPNVRHRIRRQSDLSLSLMNGLGLSNCCLSGSDLNSCCSNGCCYPNSF